ncbi:MAG: RagB/SusD family nutrient uptake outer membrane protein [Candidatus Cryptobacteroides sp.]
MKHIYLIPLLTLQALAAAACIELDTEPAGSTITSEQKAEAVRNDPAKASASVAAIFSGFTRYGNVSGESVHSDYGYPSIMLFLDSRGTDMSADLIGYNWYKDPLTYEDCLSTSTPTAIFWGTLYKQIYACNSVISGIDSDTEDSQLQYYLSQAYAVRAFDYFTLVQIYQFNCKGHEEDPGLPLITEKNAESAAEEGIARSTVAETYSLILSDIDKAIELLRSCRVKREDKRYVSLDVAYGIRARIKLVMQDWEGAAKDAEAALRNTSSSPYTYEDLLRPAFTDSGENSWMWSVIITPTDRVSTTVICNFPSHMGSFSYGYCSVGAWRRCSVKLYDSIPTSDVRKGWFLDNNGKSGHLTAAEISYLAGKGAGSYTQVKFGTNDGQLASTDNSNDFPIMRIEEMYLIKAEALGMSGQLEEATVALNDFVRTWRDPQYSVSGLSQAALQNEIWNQRRMEFWGEGMSWFDIMRLGKGVDRRGHGFPAAAVMNIPAGDNVLVYRIPQSEEQYNKLLVNNPSVAVPSPVKDE